MSTIKVTNITPQSGNNVYLTGSLTVSETLIAKEIRTELTQSVVLFQSGSTQFGDTLDDTHEFTGSLLSTGSLISNGPVTFQGIPWPSIGSEFHLFKTNPFTVNLASGDRNYDYLGVALEHFETGSIYHNSLQIYAYDNHDNPKYGTDFNVGPTRNHMRVYPSGSAVLDILNIGNISVEDKQDGTSQAIINANNIQIGLYNADTIKFGNSSTALTQSYSSGIFAGSNLVLFNSTTSISGALNLEGVGNVSDSITALQTDSGSFSTRITTNETDISALQTFSSSLDATYATDAEVSTAVSALNAATSSYALDTTLNIVSSSVDSLNAATSSYATNATLNTVSASVDSLNAATSSYALNTTLNTVSSSVDSLNAATASYATSVTHISIGELKALVSSSATYNDFTASVLAL